jgi:predicted RNA-binding Zn ribbon-like protein
LNAHASAARLSLSFSAGQQVGLVPSGSGGDRVIATLLSIVAGAIGDGTWPRLKACRNSTCRWAFYDHSRNRSGHWCSMTDCGNRAKTRAYRRRRRG